MNKEEKYINFTKKIYKYVKCIWQEDFLDYIFKNLSESHINMIFTLF
jgi:hypothetical protein